MSNCQFKDTKSIKPKCCLTQGECKFTENDETCDIKEAFRDQDKQSDGQETS